MPRTRSLFIDGSDVFRNTLIQGDLDPDKIVPFIEAAQEVDLQDWLGSFFYQTLDLLVYNAESLTPARWLASLTANGNGFDRMLDTTAPVEEGNVMFDNSMAADVTTITFMDGDNVQTLFPMDSDILVVQGESYFLGTVTAVGGTTSLTVNVTASNGEFVLPPAPMPGEMAEIAVPIGIYRSDNNADNAVTRYTGMNLVRGLDNINTTVRVDYKNFIVNHVQAILEQMAAMRYLQYGRYTVNNKGIFIHNAENASPATHADVQDIRRSIEERRGFLMERAQDFLDTNPFAEYITTRVDDLAPSYETYDSGFISL